MDISNIGNTFGDILVSKSMARMQSALVSSKNKAEENGEDTTKIDSVLLSLSALTSNDILGGESSLGSTDSLSLKMQMAELSLSSIDLLFSEDSGASSIFDAGASSILPGAEINMQDLTSMLLDDPSQAILAQSNALSQSVLSLFG